jgi:hypothetical protein
MVYLFPYTGPLRPSHGGITITCMPSTTEIDLFGVHEMPISKFKVLSSDKVPLLRFSLVKYI